MLGEMVVLCDIFDEMIVEDCEWCFEEVMVYLLIFSVMLILKVDCIIFECVWNIFWCIVEKFKF